MTDEGGGLVLPFQIDAGASRGRLVRLGEALDRILANHEYPGPVARMVGETVALGVTLSAMLKYDGLFTLQIQGDGPISMIVADITSDGNLRATAKFDGERLARAVAQAGGAEDIGGSVPRLLGAGHLAFTVDQGPDTDRYQGIVELIGMTLGDCAHQYFRRSEQLETAIKLAVRLPGAQGGGEAAALMLQRMPGTPGEEAEEKAEEAWRTAVILLGSLTDAELLDAALTPEHLLFRLFHGEGLQVFAKRPLRARCRCSQVRVENTLRSFPRAEVEAMRQDDGLVVVTCEFCKNHYSFDLVALDALYAS